MRRSIILICTLASGLLCAGVFLGRERRAAAHPERPVEPDLVRELNPSEAHVGRVIEATLAGSNGDPVRLADLAGTAATVLFLRASGCDEGSAGLPALAALEREFGSEGVRFLRVWTAAAESKEDGLVDAEGQLARAARVEASATALVLDATGTLRYAGAVAEAGRELLREAIAATLAGEAADPAATQAPGLALAPTEPVPAPVAPTFHREVARILEAKCVECHREGAAAPFVLNGFASAYDRRRMIAMVVESGIMPPWYTTDGHDRWKGDRRLSDWERETLLNWVAAGAPEGDSADAPPPMRREDGWTIGEPDLVFEMAAPQSIPAEGRVGYRRVVASRTVEQDLWVAGLEVRPGDSSVVHHARVFTVLPAELRDEQVELGVEGQVSSQWLCGYAPGRSSMRYPPGSARLVRGGSRIYFEMHYTSTGVATEDRTRLGLVLADGPVTREIDAVGLALRDFEIAPGEVREFAIEHEFSAPGQLLSMTPHMHYRGQSFRVELERPGRAPEELLSIPQWDFDWQSTYEFLEPVALEPGARIVATARFDNSAANPSNPDPSALVLHGTQTDDEMLLLGLQLERPRAATP